MKTLNLMLVIPEKANIFRINHDEPFIINLPENVAIADQERVQEAISHATNIPVPQRDPNENIENDSLLLLGDHRRQITGKVATNVLIAALDNGTPEFHNLLEICRLIALVRSIRFPDACIRTAVVDHSENACTLTSRNGRFQYRPHMGYIVGLRAMSPDVNEFVEVLNEIVFWFW
ncbi:uncharacterized protein LOC126842408 [Adelges cooleyi]|uniref:uncharacterized protein LOC126842408 n=1 Tax=Adelges cooleyi TaxID=133065 RepID=UPI00217F3931|nr:uncharacterized protein LOC126842408 [Adelges cooleyi]